MSDRQPIWPEWLERHVARITGPEDDFDAKVNGDPDGQLGEEDDLLPVAFDEMADWPEMDFDPEDEDEEGDLDDDD